MTKQLFNRKGFSLIEILLLIAIIGTVANYIFRIMYATEFHNWEDNFWRTIGFDPAVGRFLIGSVAISIWIWVAIKKRRARRSG